MPEIDFSKWIVLGVSTGPIIDGGRVVVDTIDLDRGRMTVVVASEEGCAPIDEIHREVLFLQVPKFADEVQFVERKRPLAGCWP